jgi:hypothetical protein
LRIFERACANASRAAPQRAKKANGDWMT